MLAAPSSRTLDEHVTTRSFLIGITALCVFAVAACGGSQVQGTATSAPGTTSADTETTSPSTSESNDLASVNPCSLLTKEEITALGVKREPERDKIGTSDACKFRPTGYSLIIGTRANLGLSQVQGSGGPVTDTTIGGRKAKQSGASGSCLIAMEVTATSRVDIQATGDPADLCDRASKVAGLVEPKLPR